MKLEGIFSYLCPTDSNFRFFGFLSDYGTCTFLIQDETGGLEVFDRLTQNWRPIKPLPYGILVNTADLLMHWTNSRLPSTLHRVVPIDHTKDR